MLKILISFYFIPIIFSAFSTVSAFTNGTLLPSYLCGEQTDGFPKSVGSLIPFLKLGNVNTAYNVFPSGSGTVKIQINNGVNTGSGEALAPNAQEIIGSFHNGNPANGYIHAIKNIITVLPTEFADLETGTVHEHFTFSKNEVYKLSIIVNLPVFNDPNIALDGAFVYGFNTERNRREGSFVDLGGNMQIWAACAINSHNDQVGIVHNQLLSEGPMYNVTWRAPSNSGNITFIGAGVTDAGYGPFSVTYEVS